MIAIVGGVKKCEKEYKKIMDEVNHKCKIFNTMCPNFKKKIENCQCCIVFVNTVSHKMVKSCNEICKKNNIKMLHLTNNGQEALKDSLAFI
ncbi:MAG: DUF2325 domain-containing protein [Fusobacteriaceae bacterium]